MAISLDTKGDALPGGHVLAYLPALGSNHRNPSFWSDAEVRKMVVGLHRQVTVQQARTLIRDQFGEARTPSKSALARAWMRLDKALTLSRTRPVKEAR